MKLRRREYNVTHGQALGFHIDVRDVLWAYVAAESITNAALAALGHPCCGKGIGRWSGTDWFWFRVLNLPNKLSRFDRVVAQLPITAEQARTLRPEPDAWDFVTIEGWDEDREMWFQDGRLTKVRCVDCEQLIPAVGQYYMQVMRGHDCPANDPTSEVTA